MQKEVGNRSRSQSPRRRHRRCRRRRQQNTTDIHFRYSLNIFVRFTKRVNH